MMINETQLAKVLSAQLVKAGLFFWKVEHAIGGTTGAPDFNIWLPDVPGFEHNVLVPTELKLFDKTDDGIVLTHVKTDQVDWHINAVKFGMPSIILAFGLVDGKPKLLGLKSAHIACWRTGILDPMPTIDFDPANPNLSSLLSLMRATVYSIYTKD